MKKLFTAVVLFILMQSSYAEDTALKGCPAAVEFIRSGHTNNVMESMGCIGFVRGATEAHAALLATNRLTAPFYCEPPNVTTQQRILIVAKYLEENPQELHYPASSLVMVAMRNAFPCRQ